ncbi:hypothetical protein H072_8753 [Dactylellina haptotyla CBS 200.50]|uniref:DUF1446 domain-containing protein n=1 Tax=Dactylellina haptotyla (strain CBS 200.50) TaxID=1284197 RepID=S8A8U1_DACHA|nr:hypothetical protein H072_8753 [Dactylellina haptotyla CBS 200.50]
MAAGKHPGWEQTAWDGIEQSIDIINEKRIKIIINGGAHNPKGLAEKTAELVRFKGYDLKVAYVSGDNLLPVANDLLKEGALPHLDADNSAVKLAKNTLSFLDDKYKPIVSANAYLGAREIAQGLEAGADIIIAGRVADASPVIGAAWYWHSWSETDFDRLAGALVAGHLIECSAYVTGSNFAGFYELPKEELYDLVFGIAEVEKDGSCVITKHEKGRGFVTVDTVKCQFLYELQGNIYLNSDVKAILDGVQMEQVGKDRVKVWGIVGAPPPPTTKLAIFYRGGYQSELLLNATGYATKEKWDLYEETIKFGLKKRGVLDKFDILEFQRVGVPQYNPRSQLSSTTYLRIFAEASTPVPNGQLLQTMQEFAMQHFSGFHSTMDMRTAFPIPFLSFYPAIIPQSSLNCSVTILPSISNKVPLSIQTTAPQKTEPLAKRETYDPVSPTALSNFGPTKQVKIGDVTLARSGDKGGNANVGFFVRVDRTGIQSWEWLRSFLTVSRMRELLGDDWRDEYFIERVEFPKIHAVHFVVYGILGRGVSGSARLDGLGKGIADYLRDKVVDVPVKFLEKVESHL